MTKDTNNRDSSFELIRLIAQAMIVLYHIYLVAIAPKYNDAFNTAIYLPLHIGVPLFVLISGYWGIRVSGRGIGKIVGQMFLYTVPLCLLYEFLYGNHSFVSYIKTILFISNTPYWFMRTYICLYLFSPIINSFLEGISEKNRISILCILLFISVYLGTLSIDDYTINDGKNLLNFVTLYVIGNTLHYYENSWKNIPRNKLIITYLFVNLVIFIGYILNKNTIAGKIIWILSYPYCSPVLIVNAVLFLMIIAKKSFYSEPINKYAKSSLAIYLLHGSPIIIYNIIKPFALSHRAIMGGGGFFIVALTLTIIIVIISIAIDRLLSPLWVICAKYGNVLENKICSLNRRQKKIC